MFGIGIQQPADHALILRIVFARLVLEKIHTALAKRDRDLYAFLSIDQVSGLGRKSGTTFRSPSGSSVYLIFSLMNPLSFAPLSGAVDADHVLAVREAHCEIPAPTSPKQ